MKKIVYDEIELSTPYMYKVPIWGVTYWFQSICLFMKLFLLINTFKMSYKTCVYLEIEFDV